jgi:hypothetical protein
MSLSSGGEVSVIAMSYSCFAVVASGRHRVAMRVETVLSVGLCAETEIAVSAANGADRMNDRNM